MRPKLLGMPPLASRSRKVRIPAVDPYHATAVVKPCRGSKKDFPISSLGEHPPDTALCKAPQHLVHLKDGGDFLCYCHLPLEGQENFKSPRVGIPVVVDKPLH